MGLILRRRARRPRRFALLDRDGVLNVDTGYPHRPEQLVAVPGAAALCRRLRRQGFALVVVTNQSGLAREYFEPADFRHFMQALERELDTRFDLVLACPHLQGGSSAAFGRWCTCRKPRPGLITRALRVYGGHRGSSVLIGDSRRDVNAARRAGIRRIYWLSEGRLSPRGVHRASTLDEILR